MKTAGAVRRVGRSPNSDTGEHRQNIRRGDTFYQTALPVIYADRCRGFVVPCGGEFRVFDVDEISLGTFATEAEAIAALFKGGAGNK
jgi:hypothetical protein